MSPMVVILAAWFLAITPKAFSVDQIPWPGKIELPSFAKENPGQAFAELKIYNAQGDPIRVPKEDWAGAKTRIVQDPAWQEWVQSKRAATDDWMEKRKDQVEWVAGWYHDFVSPKDGSFLTFTPDEPGADTLSSPSDPKVQLTPKLHAAWVYNFRVKNMESALDAARLYRLTGEVKYAEWAAAQLDFYADHFTEWPISNYMGKSRLTFQGLDDATSLVKLVNVARTLGDFVTPGRKERWINKLFKPDAALLHEAFHVTHNIACWHRSAEAHVALYSHDDNLWDQAVNGPFGIRSQIEQGITSDYLWYEQSFGYNNYVVDALLPFFSYALLEKHGDGLKHEMEAVENLMLAPIMMRFPNGQLPNPADTINLRYAPDIGFLGRAAQLFPTKLGAGNLATQKGWTALLDPSASDSSSHEPPAVVSQKLESSRMAIIRSGGWQVYLHYGQISASHAQAEALNFEAFFGDTDVTHDPGTVGYGSPMTRDYFRTGLCHNVPLVDGLGQESWHPGKLDNFSHASVEASQPMYRQNAQATRKLEITGATLTDTESIATTDSATHALGFVLNVQGKVKLTDRFVPDTRLAEPSRPVGFKYFQEVKSAKFQDCAEFDVAFQGVKLHVTLTLPGAFNVWHASVPDCAPDRREALYIETQGQTATLKTTFAPVAD